MSDKRKDEFTLRTRGNKEKNQVLYFSLSICQLVSYNRKP